jgi:quercetin dioxygenase-like cupin family protein
VAVSHQCEKFAELPGDPGAGAPRHGGKHGQADQVQAAETGSIQAAETGSQEHAQAKIRRADQVETGAAAEIHREPPRRAGFPNRPAQLRQVPPSRPEEVAKRHYHDVDFQMVYVLKGWLRSEFEGQGEVLLRTGACWIQPPRIKHTVLEYSDDCEVLEIILPAEFETVMLE